MCTNVCILSHMLLLQCDRHSSPWEVGPTFLPLNLVSSRLPLLTQYSISDAVWVLTLSQTKETVATWLSLLGNSPLEPSHHAANKPQLAHAERLHGEAHVERNCGPKWHLVAIASWLQELSNDSCSQIPSFYLMPQTSWYRIGNLCCVLSECVSHRIREYDKYPLYPTKFRVIRYADIVT